MRKLVLLLLLLLANLPFTALAEGSGDYSILKVEVGESGFNIYSSGGNFGSAACADGSPSTVNHVISFKKVDFPNSYPHLLSVALAAYMGGKNVSMWYAGCQLSPWNNGNMPKPVTLVIK